MPCILSASDITSLYPVQLTTNPLNLNTPNIKNVETAPSVTNVYSWRIALLPLLDCQKTTSLHEGTPYVQADSPYSLYNQIRMLFAVASLVWLLFPFVNSFAVLCCCYVWVCCFNLFLGGVASHTTNCILCSQAATALLPSVLKLLILHCGQCYNMAHIALSKNIATGHKSYYLLHTPPYIIAKAPGCSNSMFILWHTIHNFLLHHNEAAACVEVDSRLYWAGYNRSPR